MSKLAPAQALPATESPTQSYAASAADLADILRQAQDANDLPRQLAAIIQLYEHERKARIELEQQLAARATELEIINGIGQALAQQLELQAVLDLVGDKILDLRCFQAQHGPAAEPVKIAVAWMGANADPPCLSKFHGPAHDVRVSRVEAASDVDGGGKLDHGCVVAHLPSAKPFAKIAVQVDSLHLVSP